MENTKNILAIDDGLEEIKIQNRFGHELGVFYFRPTDTGIIDRYNEALTMLEKAVAPLHREKYTYEGNNLAIVKLKNHTTQNGFN